ncbi:uncharacterized protein A4U43_C04F4430 [Asparagus officinalis]|uniref:Uncharacterized protein n=1 Tax=Asparagus officinalis TaxID=4686 RepID=A0A5P1EYR0_ASPOF|nr:uncharacterized protein A4U43_C04F4430 [Asparagus officinalis]
MSLDEQMLLHNSRAEILNVNGEDILKRNKNTNIRIKKVIFLVKREGIDWCEENSETLLLRLDGLKDDNFMEEDDTYSKGLPGDFVPDLSRNRHLELRLRPAGDDVKSGSPDGGAPAGADERGDPCERDR